MQSEILLMILITLVPALELRASIPYGILNTDIHWLAVFVICVITNIILGFLIYLLLNNLLHLFLKIRPFAKIYDHYVVRLQKRIHKPVERWGELGIAVFIAVPLPGSGVYSGALAAYLLGLSYRKFIIAAIIGVLIAGAIVTLISLGGDGVWHIFLKEV